MKRDDHQGGLSAPLSLPQTTLGGPGSGARSTDALHNFDDDPELAAIVDFAATLCNPAAVHLCVLEGEQPHILAAAGSQLHEVSSDCAFCMRIIAERGLVELRDTAHDMVTINGQRARFAAGQALIDQKGTPLGALHVFDQAPRPQGLDRREREGLAVLASAAARRIIAHREAIHARAAIHQREAQLETLADSMPAMVWSADGSGKVDYRNRRLVDFLGHADDALTSLHPDDVARCYGAWQQALATGEPLEVEMRMKHVEGDYRWLLWRAVALRDAGGNVVRWFGTAVDIDTVHKLSEARDLLSKELAHRIKNIFAVVMGLVSLEMRRSPEHRAFGERLMETLGALGRAHEHVQQSGGEAQESLLRLLEVLFAPYGGAARVRVSGSNAAIAPRVATPLALVFHELATNSAKYGALSVAEGFVTLAIEDAGETLRLEWREHGSPPPPADREEQTAGNGFGSRLVEMSVTGQLGGTWKRRFEPDGLVVELTISKKAIAP